MESLYNRSDKEHKMTASRPGRLSHTQTMLYEIDMLRETAGQLEKDRWQGNFHKWVVLESFLLHFRNLVEFFGRPDPRDTDLTIQKTESFWANAANRPKDGELAQLCKPDLWAKYEEPNNPDSISKYLQHCTEHRIDARDWPVSEMYSEIRTAVDQFERLLPDSTRPWAQPRSQAGNPLGPTSTSKATVGPKAESETRETYHPSGT